ncbi:polyprenyl synthetase family protein [Thermocrinis sp.]
MKEKKIIHWKKSLEEELRRFLSPVEPKLLQEAISYYPLQEGKRIRPLIVCAVSSAYGGDVEDAITVGCAIELIHNYSLIHDDLPCMDNDYYRRGKPACHIVYGEDIALLAGDALLTLAFEILSDTKNFRTLEPKRLLWIINTISRKAGANGMVGGQVMDIKKLGDLREISIKKTAQLFSACFAVGGIIAKKDHLIPELEDVGVSFGLLFQMCDDYRDKDGFYEQLGEGLKEEIESERQEVVSKLQSLGLMTEEMEYLLNFFL